MIHFICSLRTFNVAALIFPFKQFAHIYTIFGLQNGVWDFLIFIHICIYQSQVHFNIVHTVLQSHRMGWMLFVISRSFTTSLVSCCCSANGIVMTYVMPDFMRHIHRFDQTIHERHTVTHTNKELNSIYHNRIEEKGSWHMGTTHLDACIEVKRVKLWNSHRRHKKCKGKKRTNQRIVDWLIETCLIGISPVGMISCARETYSENPIEGFSSQMNVKYFRDIFAICYVCF